MDVQMKLEARLSPLLGPFTAKIVLKTLAREKLGRQPEEITRMDLPALLEALRPVLDILAGRDKTSAVIDELGKELLAP